MSTQELVNRARERFAHNESKKYLFEKYKNQLMLTHSGGLWAITPQFLAMLRTSSTKLILLDEYNNPIEIDTRELLEKSQSIYDTIMQQWLNEYKELNNKR